MARIAIFRDVYPMPGGLPEEAQYVYSAPSVPFGYVVVPDEIAWSLEHQNVNARRLAEAAVNGEFGLSWQAYDGGPLPDLESP